MNSDMKHIIFLGAPGSGKGTQAQLIEEKYGFLHLSTGEVFRKHYANRSAETKKGKKLIDGGNFFSTEIAYQLVSDFLEKHADAKGIVYDGFPRNLEQAMYFTDLLKQRKTRESLVIEFSTNQKELIKRLLERGQASGREDDRSEQIIQRRFELYQEKTEPLVAYYKKQGCLYTINASDDIESVFETTSALINKIIN